METRANFVLIGAFTLAVIAGGFLFVLWVSGLTRISEEKTYEVIFTGSVSGLSRGSAVLFNGLRVGEVTQIDIVADDPGRVRVMTNVAGRVPIRKDTKARLENQGLTGGAAIALSGGAADAPPLVADTKGGLPTIVAEPSQLQNIVESVQSLSAKAESVLAKVDKLLSDNSDAVNDAIKNVDAFSKALGDNAPALKSALGEASDAAKSMRQLAEDLNARTKEIAVGFARFSSSGLREYEALAVDGRRAIADFDRVVRGFERNPNEVIFGAKPALPEYHGGP